MDVGGGSAGVAMKPPPRIPDVSRTRLKGIEMYNGTHAIHADTKSIASGR